MKSFAKHFRLVISHALLLSQLALFISPSEAASILPSHNWQTLSNQINLLPKNIAKLDLQFLDPLLSNGDNNSPIVILIQNQSENVQVQENVARILRFLLNRISLKTVFVQSATGDVSLSFLNDLSKSNKREKIAHTYLQSGKLSGAEYANLIDRKELILWGVENEHLYSQVLELQQSLEIELLEASKHLGKIESIITKKNGNGWVDNDYYADRNLSNILYHHKQLDSAIKAYLKHDYSVSEPGELGQRYMGQIAKPLNVLLSKLENPFDNIFIVSKAFQNIDSIWRRLVRLERQRRIEFVNRANDAMKMEDEDFSVLIVNQKHVDDVIAEFKKKSIAYVSLIPEGNSNSQSEAMRITTKPLLAQAREDLKLNKKPIIMSIASELGSKSENAVAVLLSLMQMNQSTGDMRTEQRTSLDTALQNFKDISKNANAMRYKLYINMLSSMDNADNLSLFDNPYAIHDWVRLSFIKHENSLLEINAFLDKKRMSLFREARDLMQDTTAIQSGKLWKDILQFIIMDPSLSSMVIRNMGGLIEQYRVKDEIIKLQPDWDEEKRLVKFLLNNTTQSGLPLSYKAPEGYWQDEETKVGDSIEEIIERQVVEYSVNIYDAATWQIALSLVDDQEHYEIAHEFTQRLLGGKSGNLATIRAHNDVFTYGDDGAKLDEDEAFFFRIITDQFIQKDPKDDKTMMLNFPNMPILHHEDWKPITGEQAWAGVIGPLQSLYLSNDGVIPMDSDEMYLALSLLKAFEAMTSPIGAIYHAPRGTFGKDPRDISNENNFSMLAALRMMEEVLLSHDEMKLYKRVHWLVLAIEGYFGQFAYNAEEEAFYQGGLFIENEFIPNPVFAVDCQTWGIIALGPEWIDQQFGEGTAYRIWQTTKQRAGYFDSAGRIKGVGFTDSHDILSVEWTMGAISAAAIMGEYYQTSHPDWAKELTDDSMLMRHGIEDYKVTHPDGSVAYLYASERFFIPFGWWANPISSLVSSAWVIMDNHNFDPFILGGGPNYQPQKKSKAVNRG
ncbi:MAG: hypothetical protein ACI9CF_001216 [Candidatus Omnitrophota bacterium]|jgi:hypothetical protein